jgi:hypothetical protein
MNNVSEINLILITLIKVVYDFWWLLFPILFYYLFKFLWIDYVSAYSINSWNASQKWTFLEIIPPQDIERGPKIMEPIFSGMAGVLTSYHTFGQYLEGAFWHDRFSLELVGDQGKAHFYIRTQKKYKKIVEAHIYAQYPDAEIKETSDYTDNFPKIVPNRDWNIWGSDFEFVADDALPIKTYDRFEESVTGEMIDPMASFLEALNALEEGQHLWFQLVIQPLPEPDNKKYQATIKKLKGEEVENSLGVIGDIMDVIKNIFNGMFSVVDFKGTDKKDLQPLEFRLSPVEKDRLKFAEEKIGQNLFLTKMRLLYLGKRENFDKSNISAVMGVIKQFNDVNMNQLKPDDISKTYAKIFFTQPRLAKRQRKIYARYKKRNMDDSKIVLSTKELATLFHFPDMHVKSPSLARVESKLGSAPINLPIK